MLLVGLVPQSALLGIFVVAALTQGLKGSFDAALQALVGAVVPPAKRGQYTGLVELAWGGSSLVGLPVAGALLAAAPKAMFLFLGGAQMLPALCLFLMRPLQQPAVACDAAVALDTAAADAPAEEADASTCNAPTAPASPAHAPPLPLPPSDGGTVMTWWQVWRTRRCSASASASGCRRAAGWTPRAWRPPRLRWAWRTLAASSWCVVLIRHFCFVLLHADAAPGERRRRW
jgi:hypothetical protein